ncbi:MAG: hypothetical protein IIZ10_06255 [Solobacterium sp.]|nr:hypothetical protein [Solobacterium sp.]
MKRMRRITQVLVLAGLTGLLGTGSAALTSAYLSSREMAENRADFADNVIRIEEPDFNPDTKTGPGTTVYQKRVYLQNTGNIPVYARVRIAFSDPYAQECTSFTNSTGTFAANDLGSHLPSGWTEGGDGYYYCTLPLAPQASTPDLITTAATVFRDEIGPVDYEIYVRAESVQTRFAESGKHADVSWQDAWKQAEKKQEVKTQ